MTDLSKTSLAVTSKLRIQNIENPFVITFEKEIENVGAN